MVRFSSSMITKKIPDTWHALQNEVGRILEESGFTVEIEKKVTTARGEVELDVYAEEIVRGRKYSIAIECKHWKNKVPQTVIHGFRTVVSDIGANVGYIVSLNGFQSGAFSASDLTNLELVTWEQFQNSFLETWFDVYFTKTIADELDGLMTYSEPFLPKWFDQMSEPDKDKYIAYKQKYDIFGIVVQSFGPWCRMIGDKGIPTLPLIDRLISSPETDTIPEHILNERYYREFLEASLEYGHFALGLYRELRFKYTT